MRKGYARWAFLAPVLALMNAGASAETMSADSDNDKHALTLAVTENDDSVEIELVALSPVTQKVEYALELSGSNNSRHRGSSTVTAGERHVLSKLKSGFSDSWCVTLDVTEESGESYTLTAGDCAQA